MVNPLREPGPRPLLGAQQRRERDVRHAHDRRVLRGPHRRRPRVPQRRAQGDARRRHDRPRLRARAHRRASTTLVAELERESFAELERQSGATRADMERVRADVRRRRDRAVLVWSMGITQHEQGADNVAAIVNLGLARGNVGRPGAGLMPIRGHSGVQGGAEMGAYATALPGGLEVERRQRRRAGRAVRVPGRRPPGHHRRGDGRGRRARRARRPLLVGRQLPRRAARSRRGRGGAGRVPLRVHQDIVVSSQMLVDPGEVVVLLPAATRYEQRDGGTETTTERRIAFSPEIAGPRPGEVRSEWEIFVDLARRVDPDRAGLVRVPLGSGRSATRSPGSSRCTRASRGCARPATRSSGAGRGCARAGVFPTADGRARFLRRRAVGARRARTGSFVLSTRRGKQFNTMVHDGARPAHRRRPRRAVHGAADIDRLGLHDGDRVVVRSAVRRDATPASTPATCGPATCRCSSPRATCCSAPAGAIRRPACPTTTRSSPSNRRPR